MVIKQTVPESFSYSFLYSTLRKLRVLVGRKRLKFDVYAL